MDLKQNDLERIKDQLDRGLITTDEANVKMVLYARVRIVRGSLPTSIRKALNTAVKAGTLGHMKKDGMKPEAYFHPAFAYMAKDERNRYEYNALRALAGVVARPGERYEAI